MTTNVNLKPHEIEAIHRIQATGRGEAEAELERLMQAAKARRQAVAGTASPLDYLTVEECHQRNSLVVGLTLTTSPHIEVRWRVVQRECA